MADTTQPNLGYGNQNSVDINTFNQWMRGQPWYQQMLQSWGQDPNNVHLNDQQKQQIVQAAQAHGAVIDQGHNGQQVDDSGNFQATGMGLGKKIAIGAGIAGLALTGLGAAGIGPLAGALAGGAGAADAGATAAAGGLGGVEGGAGVVGGLSSGIGGSVAALPALEGGAALLPAASTVGAVGSLANGGSGLVGGLASDGSMLPTAGGASTISQVANAAKTGNSLSNGFGAIGNAIGGAEQAAGNNRNNQANFELKAAQEERQERNNALKDVYMQSYAQNRKAGPYNPAGLPGYSQGYLDTLNNLSQQGQAQLAQPASNTAAGATNAMQPGTLSKIGQWAGPISSTIGAVSKLFG